uniref:Uncharacterized protein n=1 Tax=Fagus sylvatica TaxID=28930 RepID=A0A2N9GEY3_FAGSY
MMVDLPGRVNGYIIDHRSNDGRSITSPPEPRWWICPGPRWWNCLGESTGTSSTIAPAMVDRSRHRLNHGGGSAWESQRAEVAMEDAPDASMDAIQRCLMFEDCDETARQGRVVAEWVRMSPGAVEANFSVWNLSDRKKEKICEQGGIDVLLNDESKRETPTVVSFGGKQRFMGSVGAASATMK